MSGEPAPGSIGAIANAYASYCARVVETIAEQEKEIEALIAAMKSAGAIHCYGFGRSGSAGRSLAIRLRHFQRHLKDVWWVEDDVRNPFAAHDLFIAVSSHGTGHTLNGLVGHARERGLRCAFITAEPEGSPPGAAGEAAAGSTGEKKKDTENVADDPRTGDIVIRLPHIDPELLAPARLYGGGDFELAASLFQEVLVTRIGQRYDIDPRDVERYHVFQ